MSDATSNDWHEFWFRPQNGQPLLRARTFLCIIVAVYFLSALPDVSTWYAKGAPASSSNIASFFRTAELESDARWMVSPLYIWDSLFTGTRLAESSTVYHLYLLLGVILSLGCAFATQLANRFANPSILKRFLLSSWPSIVLWIWFVGWANRIMLLAGTFEPLASVSLAVIAFAPASPFRHWRHTFTRRVISIQTTLILIISAATMLASPMWWNGTGAYGLVAPAEDRLLSLFGPPNESGIYSALQQPWVHESLTAMLIIGLPLGCYLVWQRNWQRTGQIVIWCWCGMVAFLSANILYGLTVAALTLTLGSNQDSPKESRGEQEER